MKGLLLKEFYVWLKNRSWYMLLMLVYGVLFMVTGSSRSFFFVYIILMSLSRAFADDETSNWKNYSLALPYTPAQIVSARYLFLLAEIVISLIITTVSVTISFYGSEEFGFVKYFPYLTDNWIIISNMTVIITVLLLGFAFAMPLNYKFTGTARNVISIIPIMISVITIISISLNMTISYYIIPDTKIPKTFYDEKWLFAACAVGVLLALAASWCLCVILTARNKSRTKKIKVITAVLIAAFVAVSAVSAAVIYPKKVAEQETEELYYNNLLENMNTRDAYEKSKEDTFTLIDEFCNESHLGLPLDVCVDKLTAIGYSVDESDNYRLYKNGINITAKTEASSNIVKSIYIYCSQNKLYYDKTTDAELEALESNFTIGMTEAELQKKLHELELLPESINERYTDNGDMLRYYAIKGKTSKLNDGSPARFSINLDVVDNKIYDIRSYILADDE